MILLKSSQNTLESILQRIKDVRRLSCEQLLVLAYFATDE